MTRHETFLQWTKIVLLSAILALAVWSFGNRPPTVEAGFPQSGPTGQPVPTFAQLAGGSDGTTLRNLSTDSNGGLITSLIDPCQSSGQAKSSAPIAIAAAGTTQLVAPSGSTVVYLCGASFSIAPSATAADSLQFITGTGATCGGSTVTNTGAFGAGDLTAAAPPITISFADPGTTFKSAAASGLCAVAAGTAVSIQGVITFVQK